MQIPHEPPQGLKIANLNKIWTIYFTTPLKLRWRYGTRTACLEWYKKSTWESYAIQVKAHHTQLSFKTVYCSRMNL